MIRKLLILLLSLLLLADIGFSFLQHYHAPFDGDMAGGIVPADDVTPILESPLGLKVLTENTTYPNPNRFVCHWSFYKYFNSVPLLLQNFTDPVSSAYLSCALAKTLFQVILLFLLSLFVTGSIFKLDFLIASVIISPLFQTNGYQNYMGIIDPATTYVFFYALPAIIILVYFAPLVFKYFHSYEPKGFKYLKYLWLPLALISSLSGPLNPGIALVVSFLVFTVAFSKHYGQSFLKNPFVRFKDALQKVPHDYYFYLVPISLFSLYSLYLGKFNSVSLISKMPLVELYSRLPEGVYNIITEKLGFPVLLSILLINSIIIRYKIKSPEGKKILNAFKWIGFFALVYILLLPLGGYRSYRPNLLRYDTVIPITLSLMYIFGKTTIFILNHFNRRERYWYIPLLVLVMFVYTNADEPRFNKNTCEKDAIMQIVNSPGPVVKITDKCSVLSWKIYDDANESELNARLLKRWGITKDEKLYYQLTPKGD